MHIREIDMSNTLERLESEAGQAVRREASQIVASLSRMTTKQGKEGKIVRITLRGRAGGVHGSAETKQRVK
jgi:hypothetical protein